MLVLTYLLPLLTIQVVILKNDPIFRGSPAPDGSLESNEKRHGPYFLVPIPKRVSGTLFCMSCSHYSSAQPEVLWGQWVVPGPVFFQSQPFCASEAQKRLCKLCAGNKESKRRNGLVGTCSVRDNKTKPLSLFIADHAQGQPTPYTLNFENLSH